MHRCQQPPQVGASSVDAREGIDRGRVGTVVGGGRVGGRVGQAHQYYRRAHSQTAKLHSGRASLGSMKARWDGEALFRTIRALRQVDIRHCTLLAMAAVGGSTITGRPARHRCFGCGPRSDFIERLSLKCVHWMCGKQPSLSLNKESSTSEFRDS